jgi:hypothetical protein
LRYLDKVNSIPNAAGDAASAPFSLARACWNQRFPIAGAKSRIVAFHSAVDDPVSLLLRQYAQLTAMALEFQPDLIIELGRGWGNSTCCFTEAANRLGATRVLSIDRSNIWERTEKRLASIVPASWFDPLRIVTDNILTFDFPGALAGASRVLMFWDAHGFEVAKIVLGRIMPKLAARRHLVAMHDIGDVRYQALKSLSYGENELWAGGNNASRDLKLGFLDSNVEQAISILEESLHTELNDAQAAELESLWGADLFSRYGHWIYFSLNESPGPFTFPKIAAPPQDAPATPA